MPEVATSALSVGSCPESQRARQTVARVCAAHVHANTGTHTQPKNQLSGKSYQHLCAISGLCSLGWSRARGTGAHR